MLLIKMGLRAGAIQNREAPCRGERSVNILRRIYRLFQYASRTVTVLLGYCAVRASNRPLPLCSVCV